MSGKVVIPFNTNAGYGIGSSFETVKELCKKSKVLDGFTMQGGLERDGVFLAIRDEKRREAQMNVKSWLEKLKILKAAPQ